MAKADPLDTPMMRQYRETKAEHPDCLLFMRMGDFFELFLDDAVEAAQLLGITLTSRNKGESQEIPMAGVPHHSLQQHLPKLLAAGRKVAIMDQLEDPKQAKGLVKRGLTRIITAGTLLDEDVLEATSANWLVAITGIESLIGVAALDVSTGRFQVEEADGTRELGLILGRLQPVEIVVPEDLAGDDNAREDLLGLFIGDRQPALADVPAFAWDSGDARRLLCENLGVSDLAGFGIGPEEGHLAAAAGAAMRYASGAAHQDLSHVSGITRLHRGACLIMDAACRRNLELLRNSRDGGRQGSLLEAVDRTRTAPGGRLLAEWLARPLAAVDAITARHDAVDNLLADADQRDAIRDQLRDVYDLERLLTRVATARCHARDLVQLAGTLLACRTIGDLLEQLDPGPLLADQITRLDPAPELAETISTILVEDPPLAITDGGMVRDGVDTELDELRALRRDANQWLAAYQAREAERTGIPKIKVGYNKVFGYYLEVSKAHSDKVPPEFIRKQTLVNAERYISPELKEYEEKALGADDAIRRIESRLFEDLRLRAAGCIAKLQACADAAATVDVLAGFADLANRRSLVRPLIDASPTLHLEHARHPVVERVLGPGRFVPNDTHLEAAGDARLAVITGPNMAGKSTYIRQVALAVVLAQAGAFIPATTAHIGVVDRLFTRVGAGDELARNMSTFMVEMAETAAILHNATQRSLVILDEVGRGTSTFDGLSLAWAITEHLHDRLGCRTLFATHYHELTDLALEREGVFNLTVAVAEQDDDVTFLHSIIPGAAEMSYGIHVARLAGVPAGVVGRAREVLATLEQLNCSLAEREHPAARDPVAPATQLTLFAPSESQTMTRLRQLDPDDLSPRAAHAMLCELREQAIAERG